LNHQGGKYIQVADLAAVYDGKADFVQADVPWTAAGDFGVGKLLDGLSASVFVKNTTAGVPAWEHPLGVGAAADHGDRGSDYVVGARGCPAA
jgi:hypothetical protein